MFKLDTLWSQEPLPSRGWNFHAPLQMGLRLWKKAAANLNTGLVQFAAVRPAFFASPGRAQKTGSCSGIRRPSVRFFAAVGLCTICGMATAATETAAAGGGSPTAQAPAVRLPRIVLAGPAAVVTYPLLHMVETGALNEHAEKVEFRLWQNPDQLRVLLAKQEIDYSAAPSNLPALMANRGDPVKLLNISVWGILWLVSRDPDIRTFRDLAGKELLVPFQRDLPEVLLDTLLTAQREDGGAKEEVRLRRTRDSQDAIALMLTGKGQSALLVEPTASLLLWRAQRQGDMALYRGQNLESAWREQFPDRAELPQAGIMANSHMAANTRLNQVVEQAYAESARWCKANAGKCAELVHRYIPQLPVEPVKTAIELTRLESRSAAQARPQLEALYGLVAGRYPQSIGGHLPAAEFYGP